MENQKTQENNQNKIVESRIYAAMRSTGGIYARRLLILIARESQNAISEAYSANKQPSKDSLARYAFDLFGDMYLDFPISELLVGQKTNYEEARKAIARLEDTVVEYEDNEVEGRTHIISKHKYFKRTGLMRIRVDKEIYMALLNFAKGYVLYRPDIAISFRSEYSIIFYKLICNEKDGYSFYYSIAGIRRDFGVENKYPKPADVLANVIGVAQDELVRAKDVWFDYDVVRGYPDGRTRGRKEALGIQVTVMRHEQKKASVMINHPGAVIGADLYDYLHKEIGFTHIEIVNNMTFLGQLVREMTKERILKTVKEIRVPETVANKKGYIMAALQKVLARTLARRGRGVFQPQRQAPAAIQPAAQSVIPVSKTDAADPDYAYYAAMTLDELDEFRRGIPVEKVSPTFRRVYEDKVKEKQTQSKK